MSLPSTVQAGSVRHAAVAIVANGVLFAGFFWMATPGFETNDDVAMMRIASGLLAGEPSPYLVHTNVLIGQILRAAFTRAPETNWYSVYLVAVHFAALCGVLFVLLEQRRGVLPWLVFAVLFLLFEARFLLLLQFTNTATVAATSGVLLLLHRSRGDERPSVVWSLCGVGLLVVAAMIRRHSFLMVLMLSLPLVINMLQYRTRWRSLAWLAAAVVIGLVAIVYDHQAYASHPAWAAGNQRYALVRSIVDRGLLDHSGPAKPLFDRIGWSPTDLGMLRSRFFENDELFSKDKLELVARETADVGWYRQEWWKYLRSYFQERQAVIRIGVLLLVLAVALAGTGHRLKTALVGVSLAVLLLAGLVYLAAYIKLVNRVVLSAFFFFGAALLAFCLQIRPRPHPDSGENPRPHFGRWPRSERLARLTKRLAEFRLGRSPIPVLSTVRRVVVLLAVLGVSVESVRASRELRQINLTNRKRQAAFNRLTTAMLADYRHTGQEPVFFTWANAFPYEWCPPFSSSFRVLDSRFVGWGWTTLSPLYDDALRAHGLESGIQGLLEEPHCFLVYGDYRKALFERYLAEHFGVSHVAWTQNRVYGFTVTGGLRGGAVTVAKPVAALQ